MVEFICKACGYTYKVEYHFREDCCPCGGTFVEREIKQVIVIRKDLNIRKGKTVVQGAHASQLALHQAQRLCPDLVSSWIYDFGMKKVCVHISNLQSLHELCNAIKAALIPVHHVVDEGRTEFKEPTITALGVGPYYSDEIDKFTGKLPLL